MKDLRFSPNGKYLSVLFTSNEIALINVELGKSFLSFPSGEDASGNVCVSFEWTKLETVGPFDDFAIGSSLNFLFEKFGMKEYQEAGVGDQSDKLLSFSEVYGDLERCLLLTLCNTGTLVAYSYGIFPLFTVNLQKISRSIRSFSGLSRSPSGELLGWIGDSANNKIAFETCAFPLFIAKNISKLERFASLAIYFEDAIARFREMILVCGRKWKESTKTIIPKLMLMKSLLDGYEIAMNPVEFMYSISVCGLWHPAAVNAFTQHWNDQGLLRLKFSIDATSKFVLSTLQLRCFPLLTNLILYIR